MEGLLQGAPQKKEWWLKAERGRVCKNGASGFSGCFFIGSHCGLRGPKRFECTSMCTSTDAFAYPTRTLSIPNPSGAAPPDKRGDECDYERRVGPSPRTLTPTRTRLSLHPSAHYPTENPPLNLEAPKNNNGVELAVINLSNSLAGSTK